MKDAFSKYIDEEQLPLAMRRAIEADDPLGATEIGYRWSIRRNLMGGLQQIFGLPGSTGEAQNLPVERVVVQDNLNIPKGDEVSIDNWVTLLKDQIYPYFIRSGILEFTGPDLLKYVMWNRETFLTTGDFSTNQKSGWAWEKTLSAANGQHVKDNKLVSRRTQPPGPGSQTYVLLRPDYISESDWEKLKDEPRNKHTNILQLSGLRIKKCEGCDTIIEYQRSTKKYCDECAQKVHNVRRRQNTQIELPVTQDTSMEGWPQHPLMKQLLDEDGDE